MRTTNGEFIAAAIFDRALTDTEVEQATSELLGTWTPRQIDTRRVEAITATERITTNGLVLYPGEITVGTET
jgi:hypothetical protein